MARCSGRCRNPFARQRHPLENGKKKNTLAIALENQPTRRYRRAAGCTNQPTRPNYRYSSILASISSSYCIRYVPSLVWCVVFDPTSMCSKFLGWRNQHGHCLCWMSMGTKNGLAVNNTNTCVNRQKALFARKCSRGRSADCPIVHHTRYRIPYHICENTDKWENWLLPAPASSPPAAATGCWLVESKQHYQRISRVQPVWDS